MFKKLIVILFIPIIVILSFVSIIILYYSSPVGYIQRKTGFLSFFPKQINYFNAIDHGRDYDLLYVYEMNNFDHSRFVTYLNHQKGWSPLPISDVATSDQISDVYFSPYMKDMLETEKGYWFYDAYFDLFVYDSDKRILYIRTASCVTHYNYQSHSE